VDITLSRGVLTIQGRREAEQERRGAGYVVRERRHGSFRRSMQLPEGIDEKSISARFENGVLEVRVAGASAVQEPRRIQIESGGGTENAAAPSVSTGEQPGAEGATGGTVAGGTAGGGALAGDTAPEERPGETPPAR
jgi:HSP20 family protein